MYFAVYFGFYVIFSFASCFILINMFRGIVAVEILFDYYSSFPSNFFNE